MFQSDKLHRRAVLFALCGALCLFLYYRPASTSPADASLSGIHCEPPKNEIGRVLFTHCDPQHNGRPLFAVSFARLGVENNSLGMFRTALHKMLKVQGLSVGFYRYSSTGPANDSVALERLTADAEEFIFDFIQKLAGPVGACRLNEVDFGNVSEAYISDFDCRVFLDGSLDLAVTSNRAVASYKQAGLLLRGHVIIRTADDSRLETNCLVWDFRRQQFIVDGPYLLSRNGTKTTGKSIRLDTKLNNIDTSAAKADSQEVLKCLAKS